MAAFLQVSPKGWCCQCMQVSIPFWQMRKKLLTFLTMSEDIASIYSYFYNLLFWIFFPFTSLFWFCLVICFFTNEVANDIGCSRCRFKSVQHTLDSHTLSYFNQSVVMHMRGWSVHVSIHGSLQETSFTGMKIFQERNWKLVTHMAFLSS